MRTETKQDKTIQEYAVGYISEKTERTREYGLVYQALKNGANWQKEQDKATIDSLLETLKIIVKLDSLDNRVTVIANQAIQTYIK